jgi:hypothetical protein
MGKIRRCDSRCHNARGTRCGCWCRSTFHGTAGLVNRQALQEAVDQQLFLKEHGFKPGETAYIEQRKLPLNTSKKTLSDDGIGK